MREKLGSLVLAIVLVGCAARKPARPIMTPTGRPEVTVNAPVGEVESALVTMCVATLRGQVGKANPSVVECTGLPENFSLRLWIALNKSEVGGHADDVAKFEIIDLGNGVVRVLGSRNVTTYNAFGSVLAKDTVTAYDRTLEDGLKAAKASAEAEARASGTSAASGSSGTAAHAVPTAASSSASEPAIHARAVRIKHSPSEGAAADNDWQRVQ